MRLRLLLLVLAATLSQVLPAAFAQSPQPAALKVATRIVPPFAFHDKDGLKGFSIELWSALARDLAIKTDFVEKGSLPDLFDEVKSGRANLAIAAISITAEREQIFDFSQPMFDSGLQIMVSSTRTAAPALLPTLFSLVSSSNFQELLGLLALLIVIPVPIVWLAERTGMVRGGHTLGQILNSLWWSSSTLAGQATEMPITFLGRIMAVVWMFVGVVFVSYFTATITAGLTVKQLESGIASPADLIGKRVATVRGSTAARYLLGQSIQPTELNRIEEAYPMLESGQVDAVVYDSPILLYYVSHDGKGKVQMAGPVFRSEAYGILFPEGSNLRKSVNEALLRLRESGEYQAIYKKWFLTDKN